MEGAPLGDGLEESSSEAGISTCVDPTLNGPVYEGNAGVGLNLSNQAILFVVVSGRRRAAN